MANPADVTSGSTVYPSENGIETTLYAGSRGQEATHSVYAKNWVGNFVDSGLTFVSSSGLDITYAAGSLILCGRRVGIDSSSTVTLADDDTNHIFVQLLFVSSKTTVVRLIANTTGTPPANSVKIGAAVTAAGVVTSDFDNRNPDPYRPASITGLSLNTFLGFEKPANRTAGTTVASIVIAAETMRGRSSDLKFDVMATLFNTTGTTSQTFSIRRNGAVEKTYVRNMTTVTQVDCGCSWLFQAMDPNIVNTLDLIVATPFSAGTLEARDICATIVELNG